jgi:hypothetical protein
MRVEAAPTQSKFDSLTDDGYIEHEDWDSATGAVNDTDTSLYAGWNKNGADEDWQRCYVFFNTSTLTGRDIVQAILWISKKATDGDPFNLTIQNGQPAYPHRPLESGDFNKNYYSGNGGYYSTGSLAKIMSIQVTELGWINQTGITKFALRADFDINGETQTADRNAEFYSSDDPDDKYWPVLGVWHYPARPPHEPWKHSELVDFYDATPDDSKYYKMGKYNELMVAQAFTSHEKKHKLGTVEWCLSAWLLIEPALMRCVLYASTGYYGDTAIPTGNPLAYSEVVDCQSVGDEGSAWELVAFTFNKTNRYMMEKNGYYCMVLERLNDFGDYMEYLKVAFLDGGSGHDGNAAWWPGQWMYQSNHDFIFSLTRHNVWWFFILSLGCGTFLTGLIAVRVISKREAE